MYLLFTRELNVSEWLWVNCLASCSFQQGLSSISYRASLMILDSFDIKSGFVVLIPYSVMKDSLADIEFLVDKFVFGTQISSKPCLLQATQSSSEKSTYIFIGEFPLLCDKWFFLLLLRFCLWLLIVWLYNVSQYESLWVYSLWSSLSFLGSYVHFLPQICSCGPPFFN